MVQNPGNLPGNPGQPAVQKAAMHVAQSRLHIGPLPPPEVLRAYDAVVVGAAERILAMAEEQSRHRMALEKTVIPGRETMARLGQLFAFVLGLIGISGAVYLVYTGHDTAGATIGVAVIGSLAVAFITGKSAQDKDLASKNK